jgi:hypothetical protein
MAAQGFAGLDRRDFPGMDIMKTLITDTNLVWIGYYLTPAPSQGHKLGWMGTRAALVEQGWGLAPIYVGQQDPAAGPNNSTVLTHDQGRADALDAATMMAAEGFAQPSTVYLDIEVGGPLSTDMLTYVTAWLAGIRDEGLVPGVYCSVTTGVPAEVRAFDRGVIVWGWNLNHYNQTDAVVPVPSPAPAGCEFADASVWQLLQNCDLHDAGGATLLHDIDLDVALAQDPSALLTPPSLTVPILETLTPVEGPEAGGTPVTLAGRGLTAVTAVAFGLTSCADVAVLSDTTIAVASPQGSGAVPVIVTAPAGSTNPATAPSFTYLDTDQDITGEKG